MPQAITVNVKKTTGKIYEQMEIVFTVSFK